MNTKEVISKNVSVNKLAWYFFPTKNVKGCCQLSGYNNL